MESLQQCDAVAVGLLNIAEGDVKISLASQFQSVGNASGLAHFVALATENFLQRLPDNLFVFDDEHAALISHDKLPAFGHDPSLR
jgi:hypothetical protein